jgi:site-specific recombinase XerD
MKSDLLEEFKKSLISKGRTKNTLDVIKSTLENAQEEIKKPIENLTIEDLKKYFEGLQQKKQKNSSINLCQQRFIQFYQFCLDETDNEKYSLLIRKIKRVQISRGKNVINPNDLLLPEDIKKLINVANIERDRCIVAVLFESGIRIGELLALTTDMVQMDEVKQEVTLHIPNVEGCKTGSRSVVCLEIYGYVQDWLKCNPSKRFFDLSQMGVTLILKKIATLANISKPINPHHFRHSAITHAAGLNMSETQLSYRFWGIPHSGMLSVYIHLNEQLKSSGYRDAKGMGEGNGKTVINPLASRCVECGRLIQSGSLCKTCTDSKKLSMENKELKAQMDAQQIKMDEFQKTVGDLLKGIKLHNLAETDASILEMGAVKRARMKINDPDIKLQRDPDTDLKAEKLRKEYEEAEARQQAKVE